MKVSDIKKSINLYRNSQIFSLAEGEDGNLNLIASVGYGSVEASFSPRDDDAISHLLDVIDCLSSDAPIDFKVESFIKIS